MLWIWRRQLETAQNRVCRRWQALAEGTGRLRIVTRDHNDRAAKMGQFEGQGTARRSGTVNGDIGFQGSDL
jgi:hypothetical protein